MNPKFPAIVLCSLASTLGAAESISGAAASFNPLQALGTGARPVAMGSAFTAVGGDLASLYFNPAGLAKLKGSQASLNHNSWLGGINQETALFALGGPSLSFGLSGDLVNYGAMEGTDELGNPTESFTPMDFSVGLTMARQFAGSTGIGLALRATQQSIQDAGQLSFTGDAGAQYFSPAGLGLGISYSNFGPSVNGRSATGTLRLGISYDVVMARGYGILFSAAMAGFSNGQQQIQLGSEARLGSSLFPRLGYQANLMDQGFGGLAGLSAGLGARLGSLGLDYAYLPYGRAGQAHRISLTYNFIDALTKPDPVQANTPAPPKPAPAPGPEARPQTDKEGVELVFEVPAPAPSEESRLKAAAQAQPQDSAAWRALGNFYYARKDWPRTIEAFEKVLALDPTDARLKAWLEQLKK